MSQPDDDVLELDDMSEETVDLLYRAMEGDENAIAEFNTLVAAAREDACPRWKS